MGWFSKSEEKKCPVCGAPAKTGLLAFKLNDGSCLCETCMKHVHFEDFQNMKTLSVADMIDYQMLRRVDEERFQKFKCTQELELGPVLSHKYLRIDEENKWWYYDIKKPAWTPRIFKFEDITDFEYLEDDDTVVTKGGLTRAVVGGVLFGGIGAVVGGLTGKRESKSVINDIVVKISAKDKYRRNTIIQISVKNSTVKRDSLVYRAYKQQAEQLLNVLAKMTDIANEDAAAKEFPSAAPVVSGADEILKYKQLLDMGVISSEEFEAKKKQILGL